MGFAVCTHTFERINLYAPDPTRDSYGVPTANKNELGECFRRGVGAGAVVLGAGG